ncbi:MAG: hypothetical protein JWP89_3393 [Schlesneria sp.]|nr:hypothetical protein [Schlesneria sp.]
MTGRSLEKLLNPENPLGSSGVFAFMDPNRDSIDQGHFSECRQQVLPDPQRVRANWIPQGRLIDVFTLLAIRPPSMVRSPLPIPISGRSQWIADDFSVGWPLC